MKRVIPISIQSGLSQTGNCILLLGEEGGTRQIPLFIGAYEAQCILLAQQGAATRRPMTHETMHSIMDTFGLTLREVTIDRVEDGIFYATLHVSDGFNVSTIDSRPSDAVALATLCNAPMYVDERVLDETGVDEIPAPAPLDDRRTLQLLEEELRLCEQREDYERAAEIQKQIESLSKGS